MIVNSTLWSIHPSFAYDDKDVHPKINENAAMQSQFYLGGMLESLNFTTKEEKANVVEWIKKGGTDEDGTSDYLFMDLLEGRYFRHFHDPLKPWNQAGLTLTVPDSKSSLLWAQDYGQSFSWNSARDHYYTALVTGEEGAYAATFKALGHLMHLVADLAVPAHVRNDAHPFGTGSLIPLTWRGDFYEKWTKENFNNPELVSYQALPVNQSIFSRANPESATEQALAPVQITALWDQNRYLGNNPDITRGPDLAQFGLSEYTNANFFSQDTIFKDYDFPSLDTAFISDSDWMNPEAIVAEDNVIDKRVYVWGNAGGTGGNIRLAAASLISHDCMSIGYPPPFELDEKVHADYAKKLVPAAVGYSAALLDYFFRGKIELTPPDRFVLGIIDDADFYDPNTGARRLDASGFPVEQEFTQLKAKVRNISDDEIGSGIIQLVARYLGRDDYNPDLYNDPPQPASVQDGNGNFYPYSYSVSLPIWIPAMSKTNPTEYTFNFTDSPIPAGITDLDIFVVFKGTLGQEVDNAVAVGRIAEMNEPLHYSVENSTDYYIQNINTIPPITGQNIGFQVCFNSYPGTCQLPLATTIAPGEYSKMLLLYAGQKLGFQCKDTFSAQAGSLGWISNNSRSKFLTTDINTQIVRFRGVQTHAFWLSWTYFNYLDPYTIPAFTNPSYGGFLPFVPARPVHVNMPQ